MNALTGLFLGLGCGLVVVGIGWIIKGNWRATEWGSAYIVCGFAIAAASWFS